jgi:hypothetical protein
MKHIEIKNSDVLRGLMSRSYDMHLIDIICSVAAKYGLVMTESYRYPIRPGDLHSTDPVRAVDLRSRDYKPETLCYEIEDWINKTWQYDPARPAMRCAIIHRVAGDVYHFHVQVHLNTIKL